MKKILKNWMEIQCPSRIFRWALGVSVLALLNALTAVHAQTQTPVAAQPSPIASKMDGAKSPVSKPIKIADPWVRATVPGQKGTGGFMTITAPVDMQLVGIASPVADVAEVHEMRMEDDVMRMRAIPALALPAGKAVALAPGGYHLMLQDLKAPLLAGSTVAVTLQLQDAKGARFEQQVTLPVAMSAPDQGNDKAMQPTGAAHHHHH